MNAADETRTSADTGPGAGRTAGVEPHPTPHAPKALPDELNPFHLAIAELQADTDDLGSRRAGGWGGLPPTTWAAIGGTAIILGLLGGLLTRGSAAKNPDATQAALLKERDDRVQELEQQLARERDERQERTAALSRQIDGLEEKLAARPKTDGDTPTKADLEKLVKTEVSSRFDPLAGELKNVRELTGKLASTVSSVRNDLVAIRGKLQDVETRTAATPNPNATDTPEPAARDGDRSAREPSLAQGAELFRKGRYRDALAVFNKLESTNPDDARVWYYAALSLGLSTNEWGGGTAELVNRGIERERAGTPDTAEIDAAFKDLTINTGQAWLSEYRKRAK